MLFGWPICREALHGDSGITVSINNYCCNSSARRFEVSIEILIIRLTSNPKKPC
jgi:hypothetical protein